MDIDAPQAVALNAGEPQRFPRINGFVLIPNEVGALVGVVTWLGVERSPFPKRTGLKDFGLIDLPYPLRKLSLAPLGTLRSATRDGETRKELERGVASFPSVGDAVQIPSTQELRALIEAQDEDRRVFIGTSPLGADARVSVDPDKLFGRHLAVLGNTGSGKSCSVAGLIRFCVEAARAESTLPDGRANARFIVLDPNGEYRSTFSDLDEVRLFEVSGQGSGSETSAAKNQLQVPAWMWDSQEWSAFAQATPATQRPLLMQGLRNMRAGARVDLGMESRLATLIHGYMNMLKSRLADPTLYTDRKRGAKECGASVETLRFDLESYVGEVPSAESELEALIDDLDNHISERRDPWIENGVEKVVFYKDFTETSLRATVSCMETALQQLPEATLVGGPSEDAPMRFGPLDLAGHLESLAATPEFSDASAWAGTLLLRIRSMLADSRLAPIAAPEADLALSDWLESYIGRHDATNGNICVLDLSMIPADVMHLVVSVISRIVFEATQRYRRIEGRELPTVLVLEEAHTFVQRYLPDENSSLAARACRDSFERIAREGRKFGLGLILSSQRPSELSPTVLAQCNTFLLHRLVNDQDQQLVAKLVPDNLGGLLSELPSMPSRQAILLGWAAPVPTLVLMRLLAEEHRPHSADPAFWGVWTGEQDRVTTWNEVAEAWTGPQVVPTPDGQEEDVSASGEEE